MNEKPKRALTISEAANYACVSRATVENWLASRILPFEELPGRGTGSQKFRRIRLDDLKKFLDSHYYETRNIKTKRSASLILLEKNS